MAVAGAAERGGGDAGRAEGVGAAAKGGRQ